MREGLPPRMRRRSGPTSAALLLVDPAGPTYGDEEVSAMSDPQGVEDTHAWFREQIAHADRVELAALWEVAVQRLGHDEASRLWQEALSSSDASET